MRVGGAVEKVSNRCKADLFIYTWGATLKRVFELGRVLNKGISDSKEHAQARRLA